MKRSSATLAIALLTMSTATWAQSKQAPAGTKSAPAPPSMEPSPTASRILGPKSDEFIESMTATLAIRNRSRDAFAKHQEIQAPKTVAPKAVTGPVTAPESRITLDQIVSGITVNTIIPNEKKFLIGSRTLQVGERLPLKYEGVSYEVEIADVTSQQIVFRNIATNELGTLRLKSMPAGFAPGKGITPTAPGMEKAGTPEPLEIGKESAPAPRRR